MKSLARFLAGLVLFLAIWQAAASLLAANIILPDPREVFKLFPGLVANPLIGEATLQTLWKVLLAIALVMVLGIPLGLLLGMWTPFYDMMRPVILIIQAVPVVSWLSLVIFAWGIGWKGPIFITVLALLPVAVLTTVSGVVNLDRNLLEMARVYHVPKSKVISEIYLGSLRPFVIAVIDITIGQAWKVILVSEYLCGNSGLGVEILSARYDINIPRVYALTLLAVLLGLITERLVKLWTGRLSRKWQPA
ncbi:MAG: ABC transporter permease [Chitinophagales bacterium]